jgi:hypothetical protein
MAVRHGRQLFDVDRDRLSRVFSLRLGLRNHHRHRLADVTHLVPGNDRLKVALELGQVREPQRDYRHLCDIRSGHDRMHARHGTRRGRLDAADAAMRHGAAQHHGVQHPLALDVVDEAACAAQEAKILGPVHGLSDQRPDVHRGQALRTVA